MATKTLGYDRVMATKTKGQPAGYILVKLRRSQQLPRWVRMSLTEYERLSVIR